jgi:hypothetical protein
MSAKFELRIGCSGKADFDRLETQVNQVLEKLQFLFQVHRDFQGLIAVAQVDAAPDWRFADYLAWPLPVRQIHRWIGFILFYILHTW